MGDFAVATLRKSKAKPNEEEDGKKVLEHFLEMSKPAKWQKKKKEDVSSQASVVPCLYNSPLVLKSFKVVKKK